jgi:hypothetical protein
VPILIFFLEIKDEGRRPDTDKGKIKISKNEGNLKCQRRVEGQTHVMRKLEFPCETCYEGGRPDTDKGKTGNSVRDEL